jgi:prepilin-type N-terminal cleavage/methylation domain-containing protein/prepilin-type processing-associated H-X9-DG protein
MGKRKGFTLIELLVVIAIIALLMGILMPALSRVKKQARKVACTAQLKQWGLTWKFYCDDNDGYWLSGAGGGSGVWWVEPMLLTYDLEEDMRTCPQASKANTANKIGSWANQAWTIPDTASMNNGEDYIGSYGPNGWMCNPSSTGDAAVWGRAPARDHWRKPEVKGSYNVPLFQGQWWVDAWPRETDQPPAIVDTPYGAIPDRPNVNEMERVCADRHGGTVNNLFCDYSARPIGLKELWTLKWHRSYNVAGPWTQAGGVVASDWPQWMRGFKDY